jgi:hypothetical protein
MRLPQLQEVLLVMTAITLGACRTTTVGGADGSSGGDGSGFDGGSGDHGSGFDGDVDGGQPLTAEEVNERIRTKVAPGVLAVGDPIRAELIMRQLPGQPANLDTVDLVLVDNRTPADLFSMPLYDDGTHDDLLPGDGMWATQIDPNLNEVIGNSLLIEHPWQLTAVPGATCKMTIVGRPPREQEHWDCVYTPESLAECLATAPWHDLVGNGCGEPRVIDCAVEYDDPRRGHVIMHDPNEVGCFIPSYMNGRLASGTFGSNMRNPTEGSYGLVAERIICWRIQGATMSVGGSCLDTCLTPCPIGEHCVGSAYVQLKTLPGYSFS